LEIPRGRGGLKSQNFTSIKYEAKLEFLGGRGVQNKKKNFRRRSMDIFWNYTFPKGFLVPVYTTSFPGDGKKRDPGKVAVYTPGSRETM